MVSFLRGNIVGVEYSFYPDTAPYVRANIVNVQYSYYQDEKPFLRSNIVNVQDAYYPIVKPELRSNYVSIQYAIRAPETTMSTELFPGSADSSGSDAGRPLLKGMTYNNRARPTFSSKVSKHTSGRETATSYWENPIWEFEISFDWLPNKPGINEDFRTLCGFFMSRRGKFDTFLYKNFDDYLVEDLVVGVADGIEPEWELFRPMGSFNELIGQVDEDYLDVWLDGPKDYTIGAGPYTVTLHDDTEAIQLVKIGVTTIVDVSPAMPANGNEYNRTGDVLTFHSSRSAAVAVVTAKFLATLTTDYTVLLPRTLVFVEAPQDTVEIIASFQFFFVCRFSEDYQDFEEFADRLWNLQEMTLRSVIQ